MKVLVVKLSSLGDVIHALPALSDALEAVPGVRFDWVIEEAFAAIPSWHAGVDRVIPVALRRWRRRPLQTVAGGEWTAFRGRLKAGSYARVIDAQGLLKSALIAAMARGPSWGPDRAAAREPLAALVYRRRVSLAAESYPLVRTRQLFAAALGYPCPAGKPNYGLDRERFVRNGSGERYVMFLHGTAWPNKHWPEAHWIALGRLVNQAGCCVYLPWGSAGERARAARIAGVLTRVQVLPAMGLPEITATLAGAAAVVGLDTGLSHLAVALQTPAVLLYGATRPVSDDAWQQEQRNLSVDFPCAPCMSRVCRLGGASEPPCYDTLPPPAVWGALREVMAAREP